jgi:uncharacterized protein YbjT (DUF2867 family)
VILVTGATGNIGRHLVARLAERGAEVRAFARTPSGDLPDGVGFVAGDLAQPHTLAPALEDVDAAFLLWPQATAVGHAPTVALLASSIPRIVYLSSLTVRDDDDALAHPMSAIHADIERLIASHGADHAFLRAGRFHSNARFWAPAIREHGGVRLPYPNAGRAPVHERDLAAVAATALLEPSRVEERVVVTGPEVVTDAETLATIAEVAGARADVFLVSPEEARRDLLEGGAPADLADAALAYWESLTRVPEPVTSAVEDLTGTPPVAFREWVAENIHLFRHPAVAQGSDAGR